MNDGKGAGNAASTISITNSLQLTGKKLNGEAVLNEAGSNTGAGYKCIWLDKGEF